MERILTFVGPFGVDSRALNCVDDPEGFDRIDMDDLTGAPCALIALTSLDPENPALIRNSTAPGWEALGISNSEYVVIENVVVEGGLSGMLVGLISRPATKR